MATQERPKDGATESAAGGFKELDPVPLDLLYPDQKPTFTDPKHVEQLPVIGEPNTSQQNEVEAEKVVAPPLPPRSPLEEEEQQQQQRQTQTQVKDEEAEQAIDRESALRALLPAASTSQKLYPELPQPSSVVHVVSIKSPTTTVTQATTTSTTGKYILERLDHEDVERIIVNGKVYVNKVFEKFADIEIEFADTNNEFVQLVREYQEAETSYDESISLVEHTVNECRLNQSAVWVKKNGVAEQTQPLRVGTGVIKAQVSFSHAQFSRRQMRQLEHELTQFATNRAHTVTFKGFKRSHAIFRLEQYMYEWLGKSTLFCPRVGESDPELDNEIVDKVRMFFSVLISFERTATLNLNSGPTATMKGRKRFVKSLRNWLTHLGAALLQCGRAEERAFILKHLMDYPGIGTNAENGWVLPLLQLGPQMLLWKDNDIENFIGMLQLILTNNTDWAKRIDEADFVALLEQFPFDVAIDNMFPSRGHAGSVYVEEVKCILPRVYHVLVLLRDTSCQLKWFPQVVKLLAQTSCQLLVRAGSFVDDLEKYADCSNEGKLVWGHAQVLFDQMCLLGSQYMWTSSDQNLRVVLNSLPFSRLSNEASWRLFIALFVDYRGDDISDLAKIYGRYDEQEQTFRFKTKLSSTYIESTASSLFHKYENICGLDNWSSAIEADASIRQQFLGTLSDNKTGDKMTSVSGTSPKSEALYRIMALSSLAIGCGGELVSVVVKEIMYASYLCDDCILLNDKDLARSVRDLLAEVCDQFPWVISEILVTVSVNTDKFIVDGLQLFDCLPLERWTLNLFQDMNILRSWLTPREPGQVEPLCKLAMKIIERLNWMSDLLSSELHRDVSIMVVESYMARLSQFTSSAPSTTSANKRLSLRRWIPLTQEYNQEKDLELFKAWCWKTLLSVKFYDPYDFTPLSPLYDFTDASCASGGGSLRHLWQRTLTEAKASVEQLEESSSMVSLEAYLDPLLSFTVLQLTNYTQVINDEWLPLKVMMYHIKSSASRYSSLIESAYLNVLYNVVPTHSFNTYYPESATYVAKPLPPPKVWLFPLLGILPHREKSIFNEVWSRVLPSSPTTAQSSSTVTGSNESSPVGSPKKSASSSIVSNRLAILVQTQLDVLHENPQLHHHCRAALLFWFENVLRNNDWANSTSCKDIVNALIKASTCVNNYVRKCTPDVFLLNEIDKLLGLYLDDLICSEKKQLVILPPAAPSMFFAKSDIAGVVSNCDYLSFHALLIETGKEYPLWCALGHVLCDPSRKHLDIDVVKSNLNELLSHQGIIETVARQYVHTDVKRLSQFRIYRWASYALHVPSDHPLLILYWQVLLALIFCKSGSDLFGYKFLRRSKRSSRRFNLRERLVNRAKDLTVYFHQVARERRSCSNKKGSDENALLLAEIFNASGLWLREPDPRLWLDETSLSSLGPEYCIGRFLTLINSPLLKTLHKAVQFTSNGDLVGVRRHLWLDLVNLADESSQLSKTSKYWNTSLRYVDTAAVSSSLSNTTTTVKAKTISRSRSVSMEKSLRQQEQESKTRRSAPIYLFREPPMPSEIDIFKIEPSTLLRQLEVVASNHADGVVQLQNRLKELLALLPQLYRKQSCVKTIEKTKEKEKYRFEIQYDESVLNDVVQHKMSEIWKTCESQKFGFEVSAAKSNKTQEEEQKICVVVETVSVVSNQLCALIQQKGVANSNASIEITKRGILWFRALLAAENKKTRGYSPSQRVLWATIAKIGNVFAKNDPDESLFMLQSMLSDTSRIHLLTPLFDPTLFVGHTLDMYVLLWESLPRMTAQDTLPILQKFRFEEWLSLPPSTELKSRLLLMVGGVLRQTSWKHKPNTPELEVFNFHCRLLVEIAKSDFSQHFNQVLCILVGLVDSKTMEIGVVTHPIVWSTVLHSIDDTYWQQLDYDMLLNACNMLRGNFKKLRRHGSGSVLALHTEPGSLIQQLGGLGLIKYFLALSKKLTMLLEQQILNKAMLLEGWQSVIGMFEPWLVSVLSDETTELDLQTEQVDAAWSVNLRDTATAVVGGFVECLSILEDACSRNLVVETYWLLDRVFWFYFDVITPCAPEHVLMVVCGKLKLLPWEKWPLPLSALRYMSNTVSTLSSIHPTFLFLTNLLERLDWCATELKFDREDSASVTVNFFYGEVLRVIVSCMQRHNLPVPDSYSKFFLQVAAGLPWHYILPDQYASILVELSSRALASSGTTSTTAISTVGLVIDTAEKRSLCVLRMLGTATCLGKASILPDIEEAYMTCALQKEQTFVALLKSLLESVERFVCEGEKPLSSATTKKTTTDGDADTFAPQQSSHQLRHLRSESAKLPFPPGSYILLLFESLSRTRGVLAVISLDKCLTCSGVVEMLKQRNDGIVPCLHGLFEQYVLFFNIAGVPFAGFDFTAEESDKTAMTEIVLGKVEGALRTISSALPTAMRLDGANAGLEKEFGTITTTRRFLKADQDTRETWASWNSMWSVVLPVMIAATQHSPPFHLFPDYTYENLRENKPRKNSLKRRSSDDKSQPDCSSPKIYITGAGCGALFYCFVKNSPMVAPLLINSATLYVTSMSRLAELLEVCIESWLSVNDNIQPVLSAICQMENFSPQQLAELRQRAITRGAWLLLYVLFLQSLALEILTPQDTLVMVANSISACGNLYSASGTFLQPSPYRILPLVSLFFEICLTMTPQQSPTFKIQHLRTVVDGILAFQTDRSNSLASYASAFFTKITTSFNSSGDNSAGTADGEENHASKIHDVFKIYAKSLLLFVYVNSKKSTGLVRVEPSVPLNTGSKKVAGMMSQLAQSESLVAAWAQGFCLAPSNTLKDYQRFMDKLSDRLFPDVKWVKRQKQEWLQSKHYS